MQYNTLGEMLRQKRKELGVGHRKMAAMVGIPPTVLFETETGLRYPPDLAHLGRWADLMGLSKKEKHLMFDLAGKRRGKIAPDLPDYIKPRQYVILISIKNFKYPIVQSNPPDNFRGKVMDGLT